MRASAVGAFAPAVLLCAALGSWSLISMLFLLAFFAVQYNSPRRAPEARSRPVLWMCVVLLATTVIVAEGVIELVWAMLGNGWNLSESSLLNLLGLARLNPWQGSLGVFLSLLPQFAVALTAACALYQEQQLSQSPERQFWGCTADEEGSYWRANLRHFVLPAFQLLVGVSCPSWVALPYFVCSCVGLLHWSMTGNAVGLSWGWRPLLWCTGMHILLLYTYQLPISFPKRLTEVADYIGLFKASEEKLGWPEGVQAAALIALYILLCFAINDHCPEQSFQSSAHGGSAVDNSLPMQYSVRNTQSSSYFPDDSVAETLLPSQQPFSNREAIPLSRWWAGDGWRSVVFRHITVNFITYGFPICLIALVCWSFIYASLCAFGLLLYVGYIFYDFPSAIIIRRLNSILLGFILLWALSTYVFNAAFSVISEQSQMGMEIWHSIGLWHYLAPGLLIFAQFALGVLVATTIFVSNVGIANMSETENLYSFDDGLVSEDEEDWKVLILAVIVWCLSRSAYVISLVLILVVGMTDGLLHAVYLGFFLVYLVSSDMAKQTRQHLILFCEVHFAAVYLLQLEWISGLIEAHASQVKLILLQLGLWDRGKFHDFLSIALLLCFLALQSYGVKVLRSVSASIHQSPQPPLGWGILRVGSGRSVLLSVYASQNFGYLQRENSRDVNWVTKHLAAIAEAVRATYRSLGTYIAYGTVLTVISFVEPNYVSFGYLCLLLLWMTGRQILGRTEARLWYPLMVFAGVVFIFRYALSAIPVLRDFISEWFSLDVGFGFNADDSLIGHLWDCLAILVAMQLYRFERGQVIVYAEQPERFSDQINLNHGYPGFLKRLIILHGGKVLTVAVFYSCITPVSATGFLYLVILMGTCNMSKSSRLPGQLFAVYTGVLVLSEYLFQMCGEQTELVPGQKYGELAFWFGFRVYGKGFLGKEEGLRSKVLVLAACILQYCSFHWLDQLPASLRVDEKYEEPCFLFLPFIRLSRAAYHTPLDADPIEEISQENVIQNGFKNLPSDVKITVPSGLVEGADKGKMHRKQAVVGTGWDFLEVSDRNIPGSSKLRPTQKNAEAPSLGSPWGSAKESRRWTKRVVLLVRQERYEAQLRTLGIYYKHILENFFQLYGLEMTMLSLLVASFALLNVISLLYVLVLGLCIVLSRPALRNIWPFFVMLFACVLVMEYAVLGHGPPSWNVPLSLGEIQCNNCAYNSTSYYGYCWRCWLGIVVDDRQMLTAHFMVFLLASLQLRAHMSAKNLGSQSMHVPVHASDRLAWKELSYETCSQWTWLDHVRFFFHRYLLHAVLFLVFATGTLQYDVLHLGYLTFSLVFFRMRDTIMTKRTSIFRFLRLYNFILIVASLIYQAPYFGFLANERCAVITDLYNIVGLYKMKFGFRITARSALVDITIFCVTGLQTYIFQSREFEQVQRYLESEQVEARGHAQEAKASLKKEHLQRIRAMEERKLQRRLQVDKIKTDIIHLQLRLDILNSVGKFNEVIPPMIELDDRGSQDPSFTDFKYSDLSVHPAGESHIPHSLDRSASDTELYKISGRKMDALLVSDLETPDGQEADQHLTRRRKLAQVQQASQVKQSTSSYGASNAEKLQNQASGLQSMFTHAESQYFAVTGGEGGLFPRSSCSTESGKKSEDDLQKQRPLSGVQLLEDGVAQVQNLGNKALENLVGLFNLEPGDADDTESSSTDDEARPDKGSRFQNNVPDVKFEDYHLTDSQFEKLRISHSWRRISILCQYFCSEFASNTDVVCYFFFILAYIWNFSYLTLLYPAILFLYALLANPGPNQQFWFVMLVYTELNILLQYMYQIHVQNCDGQEFSVWLRRLGIPGSQMQHSFVISVLPLFLVYFTTLLQSSIKARDGEWMLVDETRAFPSSRHLLDRAGQTSVSYGNLKEIGKLVKDALWSVYRGLSSYWRALQSGSEAPPHFVQVSLNVRKWPEDGIQPERIESGFNKLLAAVHFTGFSEARTPLEVVADKELCSRVRVESIENSPGNPSLALAVLEVIYAAPPKASVQGEHHHTLTPAADVAAELQRLKDDGQVEETAFPYPIVSVIPGGKREVDLYALIFGTDLIAFLYVTLFFLIMLDRIFYLCSFSTGKVFYYFICLGLFTNYVSNFWWSIILGSGADHEQHFWQLLKLRVFYLMKALSFSLQALQLKYGLPHKSTLFRQFLMRKINSMTWIGFRLYRSLPFLYELRCVLDWSCTTTALTMYDWLKLEDIYASLFLVQCDIKMVRERHQLGQKQGVWIKFCSGVLLFTTLIGVIWAPMLIYSSGNPTNIVNQINYVRARVDVKTGGGKFILFETGLCQVPFLTDVLEPGSTVVQNDPYTYLSSYDLRDVQIICCEEDAETLWMIPPPTLKSLIDSIDDDLKIEFQWEFNRERPKDKEVTVYSHDAYVMNSTKIAIQLRGILNGTLHSFNIPRLYPRYFRVPGSGDVHGLVETADFGTDSHYVSGNLTLNRDGSTWWSFVRDGSYVGDGCGKSKGPIAFAVSEEVPNGIIGETLSKFSIWSLYLTFVLAVGRFIRLQCSDIRMRIPFENFPACDRLLAICEDIYAARSERELELEEGLFWTLIKIYRSPHILMEYTKVE